MGKTAIAFVWITDDVQQCHVGFAPWQYMKDVTAYDGALFQVMEIMDTSNIKNVTKRRRVHHYCRIARAVYIGEEEDWQGYCKNRVKQYAQGGQLQDTTNKWKVTKV